jgi:hypothetical protein
VGAVMQKYFSFCMTEVSITAKLMVKLFLSNHLLQKETKKEKWKTG